MHEGRFPCVQHVQISLYNFNFSIHESESYGDQQLLSITLNIIYII